MREHLVASFDEALERADRLISDMGDLAGKMVAAATYALLTADVGLAERVIADDAVMDAKQRDIDERASGFPLGETPETETIDAPHLLEPHHAAYLDKGIQRAGGDAICDHCGELYYDHPRVVGALWVTELCDGRLVKL